jgi:benzoyl-CoA reductase/2-hydroxyglutaryl-CoA dehydratase subunit BcrC/BadD/HgdB
MNDIEKIGITYTFFENAYEQQRDMALNWQENGGKVVGCLGSDIPEEILIAFGIMPVHICGNRKNTTTQADQFLEEGFNQRIKSQFEQIVNGTYYYLNHLIISNSSDAIIRVYYYLRAAKKYNLSLPLPELYFFDFLHSRFRESALYNRERLMALIKYLENWTGESLNQEKLHNAIQLCNKNRELLRQLKDLRCSQEVRISGTMALKILTSSSFTPKEVHNQALEGFLTQVKHLSVMKGKRIFISGSSHDHTQFYELVESCGGVIVGEDHEFSSRRFDNQVSTNVDPIDGIVDCYHLRVPPTYQATVSERVNSLIKEVKETKAEGVIFYIHKADDAPSWDFPEQREALKALGIPALLLDRQAYGVNDKNQMAKNVSAFIQAIK